MSRIYDALKKLEAERAGKASGNGHGNGHGNGPHANGHGTGNGNGHGNGNGNGHGKRGGWRWLFPDHGQSNDHPRVALSFDLGPDVEEAYQRLGTHLLVAPASDTGAAPRVLGITASRHGEGTTTTAAIFASVLVRRRGGRVVVVEANFRSPGFDVVFGIPRNGGFAELIEGTKSLPEVALPTAIPNLLAIGCGHSSLAATTLFDSPGVTAALDQLRSQFEFVIVDLPPANLYVDASILAPRLDAALIVIEADRTRIPEVERLRRSLDRVGVKLVGSILNRRRSYIPGFLEEML